MQKNPFDKFNNPSNYHLKGDSESARLDNIKDRIGRLESSKKRRISLRYLLVAASILLIVFFLLPHSPTPEKVASNYFEPYRNYQVEKIRGEASTRNLMEAYNAYDDKDFEAAINLFESNKDLLEPLDNLYYGIALLGNNDWSASLQILKENKNKLAFEHVDALQWYIALAALGGNDVELCKQTLTQILQNKNSFYHSRALKLMEEI